MIDKENYEDFTFILTKNCFVYVELFDNVSGDTLYLYGWLIHFRTIFAVFLLRFCLVFYFSV